MNQIIDNQDDTEECFTEDRGFTTVIHNHPRGFERALDGALFASGAMFAVGLNVAAYRLLVRLFS